MIVFVAHLAHLSNLLKPYQGLNKAFLLLLHILTILVLHLTILITFGFYPKMVLLNHLAIYVHLAIKQTNPHCGYRRVTAKLSDVNRNGFNISFRQWGGSFKVKGEKCYFFTDFRLL